MNNIKNLTDRLRRLIARRLLRLQHISTEGISEERLIGRRCRCGKHATELHRACAWHDATSAQYAGELEAIVREVLR